jgi:hypothetical protein
VNWEDASRQTVILLSFPPPIVTHINLQALQFKVNIQDGELPLLQSGMDRANQQPMYSNESTSGPKPQFEMGKLVYPV